MFNNIIEAKVLRSTSAVVRLLIFFLSLTFLVSCDDFRISWESQNYPIKKVSPKLKVYIENSGSMDGYMCEGSELKEGSSDISSDMAVMQCIES